jgi:hypothetical protein
MGTASIHEGVRRMRLPSLLERQERSEITQDDFSASGYCAAAWRAKPSRSENKSLADGQRRQNRVAEFVQQGCHGPPASAVTRRDGRQSELPERLHGFRNQFFGCSGQMEAAQDRVQGHVRKSRPGILQNVDDAGMRTRGQHDKPLAGDMDAEPTLVDDPRIGFPSLPIQVF